ncbi:hypothetical protein LCGC14_0920570 [marine sediment metagenome]|uniref:Uncharacterized protein n=1 Tax=marine sediment metagenome TaxID=412755 RepID=A0A0F9PBN3_9ZZZZ
MDNYIIREGDILGRTDGKPPFHVHEITRTQITFSVRDVRRTVSRERFRYWLWHGGLFLLERAS